MNPIGNIAAPYLIFMGDVRSDIDAKTGFGIATWRNGDCLGQARMPGCSVDLGLPELSPEQAVGRGARTLIIGIAPAGGAMPDSWIEPLAAALAAGLDIASGLHVRLESIPALKAAAERFGRRLIDVRHPRESFSVATGAKRTGKRLLTVGTDCAVGKKYTALAIHAALANRGIPATFRATGQTGMLIGGGGIAVDAIVADFVAGAAEALSPSAAVDHWDVIEGQGSLFHPAFAGVSLGLLHGSQPDVFVVCHESTRKLLVGTAVPAPRIEDVMEMTARLGSVTNSRIRCGGIAINTARLEPPVARAMLEGLQERFGLPCTDPIRFGVECIVQALT